MEIISGLPIPLKRTGAAIDRLFALPVEAIGDWVEKKLKSNLESHVDAVRKSRGRRGKKVEIDEKTISLEKLKSIHEWAEKAGEVDPDDDVLSAGWRAALDRLLDDDKEGDELLRMLLELPNATIRFFFARFGKGDHVFFGRGMAHLKKLEEAGLVVPMLDIRWTILVGIVIVLGFFASQELAFSGRLLLLIGGGSSLISVFVLSQRFRLTVSGREILTRFQTYMSEASDV